MIHTKVFISGHRNITEYEFNTHYTKLIDEYIDWVNAISPLGDKCLTFYVGDCEGCDKMTIYYLISKLCHNIKLVICSLKRPFVGQIDYSLCQNDNITVIKKFITHEERDSYMTSNTTCDIMWIRPGQWTSGTAQNFVRRHWGKNKSDT